LSQSPSSAAAAAAADTAPPYAINHHARRGFTSDASNNGSNNGSGQRHSAIYVTDGAGTTIAHHTPLLLGLLNYFERHLPFVGYFTPVGGSGEAGPLPGVVQKHLELIRTVHGGDERCVRMIGCFVCLFAQPPA
jgi:hypothetical protein